MNRPDSDLLLMKKEQAISRLPSLMKPEDQCHYLSRDYSTFIRLDRRLPQGCRMISPAGSARDELEEVREEYLELFSSLNRRFASRVWWGTVLASRTSMTIPLQLNIACLFYVRGLLDRLNRHDSSGRIIIIGESQAVLDSIAALAKERDIRVARPGHHRSKSIAGLRLALLYLIRVVRFLWHCFRNSRQAHSRMDPLTFDPDFRGPRTIIRSWVTPDSFTGPDDYQDRNFGDLPDWLTTRGHQVVILPMFIDVNVPLKSLFRQMKGRKVEFLIQYHYLKWSDYINAVYAGFRQLCLPMRDIVLDSIDLSLLFREMKFQQGFNRGPMTANLCYPLLRRLRQKGITIDAFIYPFENNVPEKTFILACRKHYPDATISAYQHTVWFRDQLGMILAENESEHHPLADRIICSGPIYPEILQRAGFPREIIESGPSLRFSSVFDRSGANGGGMERPNLLLPLNYSDDQACELIHKVSLARHDMPDRTIYIRKHPVLDETALQRFLTGIKMTDYREADGGSIRDWLVNTDIVITTGATVVILEAAIMGIPVIRVVPDNDFILDPLAWSDYPIQPVNTPGEIGEAVAGILEFSDDDHDHLRRIGREMLSDYFQEVTDHNLEIFSRLR